MVPAASSSLSDAERGLSYSIFQEKEKSSTEVFVTKKIKKCQRRLFERRVLLQENYELRRIS